MNMIKSPRKKKQNDPIAYKLGILHDELKLAIRWRRPSILMAVYQSRLTLIVARIGLEQKLRKSKQHVCNLEINAETVDLPLFLSRYPRKENTVFFVSGLMKFSKGGLNVYRALNIRRELLVDNRIRVVFWLTPQESTALPTLALDFWAFRHRILELFDQPDTPQLKTLVETLGWPAWDLQKLRAELPAGLLLRSEFLEQIPDSDEAPVMRAELLYQLAGLHWADGNLSTALELLDNGLALTIKNDLTHLQPRFLSSIGLVHQAQAQLEQAARDYQLSLQFDPTSAVTWGYLGQVLKELGRLAEALPAARKATELDSSLIAPWACLGDIQRDSGQIRQAINSYKQALSINSNDARLWISLGESYRYLKKFTEAVEPFKKALKLKPDNELLYIKLGNTYQELGRNSNAIRSFHKAVRLNPHNTTPLKALGDIYRSEHRLKEARGAYEQALALSPEDQSIREALKNLQPR